MNDDSTDIYALAEEHLNGYLFDLAKRRDRAEQNVQEALAAVEAARQNVDLIDRKVESTEALLALISDSDSNDTDEPKPWPAREASDRTVFHSMQFHAR